MVRLLQFLFGSLLAMSALLFFLLENPNELKSEIAEIVSLSTPYEVEIKGDLDWRYWPPIAIQANDIILTAPDDLVLANIEQLEIDVDLAPLLIRQPILDINSLILRGGWMNYQVKPSGDSNWLARAGESENRTTDSPPAPTIHEFRVNDLLINYQAKQNYQVTINHLQTSKLMTDSPFDISANLIIKDLENNGSLQIATTGQLIFTSNDRLRFDRLVADISLDSYLPVSLNTNGELHIERQVILVNKAAITYDTLIASLTGIINFSGEPRLDGEISLQTANINQLLDTNLPFSALQLSAGLAASPRSIKLSTIKGELDQNQFKGSIETTTNKLLKIEGDLRFDNLNLTKQSPAKKRPSISTPNTKVDSEILPKTLKPYQFNLITRFNRFRYADFDLSAAKIDITSSPDKLEVIANTRLLNGKLVASMNSDWSKTNLVISADRLDISAMTNDQSITGRLTGSGVYDFSGDRLSDLENTLTGRSTFSISEGSIDVRPIKELARTIDSLRGKTSRITNWPDKQPFKNMSAQHLFQGGTLKGQILNAKIENLRLTAAGGFNIFQESLDYEITAMFERGTNGTFTVSDQLAGIRWPLKCQGNFDEYPADLCFGQNGAIEELVANLVRQELKRKGNKKLDQLIEEKVPEGLQDLTRDLLKDLFR